MARLRAACRPLCGRHAGGRRPAGRHRGDRSVQRQRVPRGLLRRPQDPGGARERQLPVPGRGAASTARPAGRGGARLPGTVARAGRRCGGRHVRPPADGRGGRGGGVRTGRGARIRGPDRRARAGRTGAALPRGLVPVLHGGHDRAAEGSRVRHRPQRREHPDPRPADARPGRRRLGRPRGRPRTGAPPSWTVARSAAGLAADAQHRPDHGVAAGADRRRPGGHPDLTALRRGGTPDDGGADASAHRVHRRGRLRPAHR